MKARTRGEIAAAIADRVTGKHALITGGSRGLGLVIARTLGNLGANVTLSARTESELRKAVAGLASLPGNATYVVADVLDAKSRQELLDQAQANQGPIDILINNAGIEAMGTFATMPADLVQTMGETNFIAPIMLTRAVLPAMLARGSGQIVTMSSLGGKKGSPYSATYAGTKAALTTWSTALRQELLDTGVGASVIAPGFVSDVGIFADTGEEPHPLLKASTSQQVATAVVRAIAENQREIIVNPGPKRLLGTVDAISPEFVTWLLWKGGIYDYYVRQAKIGEAARADWQPKAILDETR